MSDLTPAQRIEAAIVRLEELKEESTPGPWVWEAPSGEPWPFADESLMGGEDATVQVLAGWGYDACGIDGEEADRQLIVTLHATIDPMLEIMRGAARYMNFFGDDAHDYVIALADAIISGGTE